MPPCDATKEYNFHWQASYPILLILMHTGALTLAHLACVLALNIIHLLPTATFLLPAQISSFITLIYVTAFEMSPFLSHLKVSMKKLMHCSKICFSNIPFHLSNQG